MPFLPTGRYVTSIPSLSIALHESRTHLCSYTNKQRTATPTHSHTHYLCGDHVILLGSVEPSHTLWEELRDVTTPTTDHLTLMAMLFDSVAPLVNMISLGSAPIRSATC